MSMVCPGVGAPLRTSLVRTAGEAPRTVDEDERTPLDDGVDDERVVPDEDGVETRVDEEEERVEEEDDERRL